MTLEEYSEERILTDLQKLLYLYSLKRVIRYNQSRNEEIQTESVAEHVFGMHLLAQYFIPLEDPDVKMDRATILTMITLHDIDEVDYVEKGDFIGYLKTAAMRENELEGMLRTSNQSPLHMQKSMTRAICEYEASETLEAKFVKALDKIEPVVHLNNQRVAPLLKEVLKCTATQSLSIKTPYVADFPFIKKFCDIAHNHLEQAGYFWTEEE